MPSFTDRLSLIRHTLADVFRVEDYAENWERLDEFPGVFVCTSGARPIDWGERQEGQVIFETDTNLFWTWNGDSWVRHLSRGNIGYQTVTSQVQTASTSLQTAVSAAVTVASGNRRHRISVGASEVHNTNDLTRISILRDGTTLAEWEHQGGTGGTPAEQPRHLSKAVYDLPTAGARTYTLEFSAVSGNGGTSTIEADANNPIFLAVDEV